MTKTTTLNALLGALLALGLALSATACDGATWPPQGMKGESNDHREKAPAASADVPPALASGLASDQIATATVDYEPPGVPYGDVSYACSSMASNAGISDASFTTDCVELVSMAYQMCGGGMDGDAMIQCVNRAFTGDDLAACLAPCEP